MSSQNTLSVVLDTINNRVCAFLDTDQRSSGICISDTVLSITETY